MRSAWPYSCLLPTYRERCRTRERDRDRWRERERERAVHSFSHSHFQERESDVRAIRKAYANARVLAPVLHRTLTLRYRRRPATTTLSRFGLSHLFHCTLSPRASLSHRSLSFSFYFYGSKPPLPRSLIVRTCARPILFIC